MKFERIALLLLRLYIGYLFLTAGWDKWVADPSFTTGEALSAFLQKGLVESQPGSISAALIQSYFIPNAKALAWLVVVGELCVGAALLTGTATRIACVVGIFMNVNFLVVTHGTFQTFDNNIFFILIQLALLASAAGRFMGIDYFLSKKFSNNYLW